MTADIVPSYVPRLVCSHRSTATTYHFRCEPRGFGWALCTVNDQTGELLIMSDWGHWSHRWSADPTHLGRPTLTHFIAERDHGATDYLAMKLLTRDAAYEWDRDATVREFHKRIIECRLEHGRNPCLQRITGRRTLTRWVAREMWETLAELKHAHDERAFLEGFIADDDLSYWVSERPFEETQHRLSRDYEILAKGILPALIEACRENLDERAQRERMETGHA